MQAHSGQQLEIFRRMRRIRAFETEVNKQMAAGEIAGSCHSSIGHEAAIVGACMALGKDDYITGTHRSHGHPIGKGAELNPLMAELFGRASGVCKGRGGSMHLADNSVGIIGESAIVGGGMPLATGAGLSARVRGSGQVSLCFFGDGASNQGTFHESINMAAVWQLPVVYFCENNLYAATTPALKSHGQPDIAKRAAGYGIPGVIVDGQDVEAVYEATTAAVERARCGEGPTLIEAKTYRFDEHAIGLYVGEGYRSAQEVEQWKNTRDPLILYRTQLIDNGVEEDLLAAIEAEVARSIEQAVAFAKQSPLPEADEVYQHMFSNPIHYPPTA